MDGWKNYPTWAVALWLENERTMYNEVHFLLEGVPKEEQPDIVKEYIEENAPIEGGLYFDLLNYALEQVDYKQVAYKLRGETWE